MVCRYLVLPLFLTLLLPAWSQSNVPPHEAFWQQPASATPHTLLLWHFDGKAKLSDDAVLDMMEAGIEALASGGRQLDMSTTSNVAFVLNGEAEQVSEGRFGGSVRLGPGGTVRGTAIPFDPLLRERKPFFLEWWVKAAAEPTRPVPLMAMPAGDGSGALRVMHGADNTLSLWWGEELLVTHERQLPPDTWRHLALRIDRVATFFVDGAPAMSDRSATAIAALQRRPGNSLHFGGESALWIDAVHLRSGTVHLYQQEDSIADPELRRELVDGPPYLSRTGPFRAVVPFDGDAEPSVFAAFAAATKAPAELFVPGVRGQAIDLSKVTSETLELQGFSLIPEENGTIEFWFKPLDWHNLKMGGWLGEGVSWRRLFSLGAKGTPPYLAHRAVNVRMGRAGADSDKPWVTITPGAWRHVVITWAKGGATIYLDGKRQTISQISYQHWPHPLHRRAHTEWTERTGGQDDGTFRLTLAQSPTLLDELRIYDRSLSPEEVWNAYARYLPNAQEAMRLLPYVNAEFQFVAHSWSMVPRLRVNLAALPVDDKDPRSMHLELRDAAGNLLHERGEIALDEAGKATIELAGELDFGSYTANLSSFAEDGTPLKQGSVTYLREQPPWYKTDLGRDHSVPPPWTPIEADGRQLSVWGRTIELSAAGLPVAVSSVEQAVLAGPVLLRIDDEALTATGELELHQQHGDRIEWNGRLASESVEAAVAAWMEFDGLQYYTVTLTPTRERATVRTLSVDIPLRAAVTSQLIANSGGQNFRAAWDIRMIPAGEGRIWDSLTSKPKMERGVKSGSFIPQIWVGGDVVGLNVYCENDQGWTITEGVPAQELRREGEAVLFRMNVIGEPVELDGPRTFTFTLMPTPSKPEPVGWRGWNRADRETPLNVYDMIDKFNGFSLSAEAGRTGSLDDFTVEPHTWEDAAHQAELLREKFGRNNPLKMYMDYSWPSPGPTFADWNHDLWAGAGRIAWIPELEDYFVWLINEYLQRGLIDGLYIDDVSLGRTYSLASTGYLDPTADSGRRLGFSTLGFRRFLMRIWRLFEAEGKTPHFTAHMTYVFELPALSFCQAIVNGEAREMHPYAKHDTIDSWSRDELRIMGNAPKWGFATFWKPTVQKVETASDQGMLAPWLHRQSRAMHATIVQADMWYLWHYPTGRLILPDFIAFGLSDPDLRFIPYWANDDIVTTEAEAAKDIAVGIFAKPDRALVMISNFAGGEQQAAVSIDPQALFGGNATTVEWIERDSSLQAPPELVAAGDIPTAPAANDLAKGAGDLLGNLNIEDMLSGATKEEKAQAALEPEIDGNTIKLLIRRHDYRLFEVRPKP